MIENKLTTCQVEGIVKFATELKKKHSDWRMGQSVFNAMLILYPDTSDEIRTTEYDPYYSDNKIEKCLIKITK